MSKFTIKNIASGIFSHWALLVLQILVSLFMTPFVVNTLDNLYFGLWVTLMQFTGYLYLLDFGLRNTVVHRTSQAIAGRRRTSLHPLLKAATRLSAAIAGVTIVVAGVMALFVPTLFDLSPNVEFESAITIFIAGCTVALAIWNNPYEGVARGFGLFLPLSAFGVIALAVRTALTVLFLLMGYKIVALALVQLVIGMLNAGFVLYLAKSSLARERFPRAEQSLSTRRFLALSRSVWRYSWSIFIDNFSRKLIFSANTVIIGLVLGVPTVTFYAIASQLIEHLRGLIDVCMSIIMPVASRITGSDDQSDLEFVLFQGARFVAWFSLPIITIYLVLGEMFIGLWVGQEYAATAGAVLVILGAAQASSLMQYSITVVMRSLEKHRVIAYLRLVEAIINIVLSTALAYRMGLIGVAIGTAIAQVLIATVVLPRFILQHMKISYFRLLSTAYVRTTIVCAIIGSLGWLMREFAPPGSLVAFIAQAAGLGVIYVLLSYFLVIDNTERERLRGWRNGALRAS